MNIVEINKELVTVCDECFEDSMNNVNTSDNCVCDICGRNEKLCVIYWNDNGVTRYHVSSEKHGTEIIEDADEFEVCEAKELIDKNDWFNCEIYEI